METAKTVEKNYALIDRILLFCKLLFLLFKLRTFKNNNIKVIKK